MKFFAPLRSMQKICSPCLTLLATLTLMALSIENTKAGVNLNTVFSNLENTVANFPISGTVVDEQGQPMPGVSVQLKGTTIGTVTDINGKFALSVPDDGGTISFSFLGYTTYTQQVDKTKRILNISLKPSATSLLNEVVVTAFGVQKKVNVTGAVSTIDAKDVVASSVSNITNALVGNAPGISGLQTSGEPGRNGTKIYIRGVATFGGNSTDPLIVIDGIEQPSENGKSYDQLNAMDANEIESISILKDAASTAVYGIRGANGVIIVTTKRGVNGKPTLSFTSNFAGTKAANLTQSASSYDFALTRNRAINAYNQNENNPSYNTLLFTPDELWKFQNNRDYTPAEVDAMTFLTPEQKASLNQSPALYYGSHDYYREQFGDIGKQAQYNLSVRGGNEKVKYYSSLGYFNQGSILRDFNLDGTNTGSHYNRSNFRSNFDIKPVKSTTISVNLSGQFGAVTGPSFGTNPYDNNTRYKQMIQFLQEGNTFQVPGVIDGKLVTGVYGANGGISISNPLGTKQTFNSTPDAILLQSPSGIYNQTLLTASVKIKHDMDYLLKGLSIRGTANYDDSYNKYITISSTLPSYTVRRDPTNPNNLQYFGGTINPVSFNGDSYTGTYHKVYFDAGIDYETKIGGSNITALILGKASKFSIPFGDQFNTPSGIMGLVNRITYNYKERYQAEFNLGYNGTENFAPGRRFGFFPAYSAGWVPTSEAFFPKNKYITFLKFRGSYGEVGNDQFNAARYLFLPSQYSLNQANYYLGTSNGTDHLPTYSTAKEGALGNPLVTWERSVKSDIGAEARFFKDKLNLVVDFYQEKRNNILTTLGTIPSTFGNNQVPPVNVGATTNKGYEVSLGWRSNVGQFNYGISGALSYNKSKIDYKAEPSNPNPWQNLTGAPINQYFGLVSDGFFNTPEELANRPYNSFNSNLNTLGDIRYKDLNGDNIIDNQDQTSIGYSNLPQFAFNSRLNLSYKGFDASVLFNGTAKGSFYLPQNMVDVYFKQYGNLYQWQVDGAWTPEKVANGEAITYPRVEINTNTSNSNFVKSDFWLRSTDFVKLKNIEIGYSLKDLNLLRSLKISSLRIYANANNLFTFKNDLKQFGLDPETADYNNAGYGNNQGYYFPITKVYNFGLNVQF
ncbi:TonB-dependent receptor [Pedobacter sp. SD-b]|uniref:TonB-dependent receptor n=1 Tax=Pedobacter segetis TaxID=2793069 RepID=A0ABS1BML8_9SPHI|nr:TonB-dependent receptor [Pedobacter segetis]MBK0384134.1 TonB-dependent receptor [Pedobacter segetis]